MNRDFSRSIYISSNIDFLVDTPITRYKIIDSEISILKENNIIEQEMFDYLSKSGEKEKSYFINALIRDNKGINKIISDGIKKLRYIFLHTNQIKNSDVISLSKDFITVKGKEASDLTISETAKFRIDGKFTSFYRLNSVEMYYNYNHVYNSEFVDVGIIGATDSSIKNFRSFHDSYFIEFLSELFYSAQTEGLQTAIMLLQTVYSNYISLKLPVQFYREFNLDSKYRLKREFTSVGAIYADFATERDKAIFDISYNENILRTINRMYASLYFDGKR